MRRNVTKWLRLGFILAAFMTLIISGGTTVLAADFSTSDAGTFITADSSIALGSFVASGTTGSSAVVTASSQSTDSSATPSAYYGTVYTNSETGYSIVIEDDASLLTDTEKAALIEDMKPVTSYGHAALKTTKSNSYSSTSRYAQSYYSSKFGYDSGTVFVIDMDERELYIYSYGKVYSTVTTDYANVITDNVYTYASAGNYYTCASNVFAQEAALLAGRRISQPMKYISNALLAIVLAILINYMIVRMVSSKHAASQNELVKGIFVNNALNNSRVVLTRQTKTYAPRSSDSGGGGGHGGGGGGGHSGGGGGHSGGGGGGHKF